MAYHRADFRWILWLLFLVVAGFISACTPGHVPGRVQEDETFTVDLTKIPDGIYRGGHHLEGINYEVEVSVDSHRIVEIKILGGMQRVFHKKCALCEVNDLIWEIIELQTVDAVSGATQTSIAILRAISDAISPPYSHD